LQLRSLLLARFTKDLNLLPLFYSIYVHSVNTPTFSYDNYALLVQYLLNSPIPIALTLQIRINSRIPHLNANQLPGLELYHFIRNTSVTMGNKNSTQQQYQRQAFNNVQYYHRHSPDNGPMLSGDSPPRFSGSPTKAFDSPSFLKKSFKLHSQLSTSPSSSSSSGDHVGSPSHSNIHNYNSPSSSRHIPVEQQLRITNKQVIGGEEYTFFVPLEVGDFIISLWCRNNHNDTHAHLRDLYSMYIYKNGERLSNLGDAFPLHEKLNNWTEETLALNEVDEIVQLLEKEAILQENDDNLSTTSGHSQ